MVRYNSRKKDSNSVWANKGAAQKQSVPHWLVVLQQLLYSSPSSSKSMGWNIRHDWHFNPLYKKKASVMSCFGHSTFWSRTTKPLQYELNVCLKCHLNSVTWDYDVTHHFHSVLPQLRALLGFTKNKPFKRGRNPQNFKKASILILPVLLIFFPFFSLYFSYFKWLKN